MEKIEFEVNYSFWDDMKTSWIGFWLSRRPRICGILTLFFFFVAATIVSGAPEYRHLVRLAVIFVVSLWLFSFVCLFLKALSEHKASAKSGKNEVQCIDEEGYRFESDSVNAYMKWNYFRSVRESRKYFFLTTITDTIFIIPKNTISGVEISTLRKVLEAAPVKKKRLH